MARDSDDERWVRRAFELALKGAGGASPNPMVGCVIVRGGRAIAEGYHAKFGGPHAEIEALRANKDFRGSTLYTNLEPCCHQGKTGPCTEAVIRAGVKRVVSAMTDPFPQVAGQGFTRLRKAGIEVRAGVLQAEARDLNRSFIKLVTRRMPYVFLKAAMSLDGKCATAAGDSKWITSAPALRRSRQLRTEMDAILVGAETVRKDDPSLTSHGLGRNPVRVVVSGSGRLPARAKIFNGEAPTWIFHAGTRRDERNASWIAAPARKGRIDMKAVLRELGRRGISRLLVEGGGETAAGILATGELDECLFWIAPKLIGGAQAPTPVDGPGLRRLSQAVALKGLSAEAVGPDLLVSARVN